MNNMKNMMNWLAAEESGQGMVEYALLIVCIALAVVLALTAMGGSVNSLYERAANVFKK